MAKLLSLRRIVIILIAVPVSLVALLLVLVRFVLPGMLPDRVGRYVLEQTGHHLSFDQPEIQLFGPRLVLRHLKLTEPDGRPLLSFASLEVEITAAALLHHTLHLERVALADPEATVVIRKDGQLNWSALIKALQDKHPAAPETPAASSRKAMAVEIHALAVTGAHVNGADERIDFAAQTTPIDFRLSDFSTAGDVAGRYQLSAITSLGAQVTLDGQAAMQPNVHAQGHFQIEGLDLARLGPLVNADTPVRIPSGIAGLALDYRVGYAPGKLDLTLDGVQGGLKNLEVRQAVENSPVLTVASLTLAQGHFELGPQQAALGSLNIDGTEVQLPRPGGAPVSVKLGALAVTGIGADLGRHAAEVARVTLEGSDLEVLRQADGHVDLLDALQGLAGNAPANAVKPVAGEPEVATLHGAPAARAAERTSAPAARAALPAAKSATAAPIAKAAPWHYQVHSLALAKVRARFRDESVKPQAELGIDGLGVEVEGVSDDLSQPLKVRSSFQVSSGGSFEAQGTVIPKTPSADLQFRLADLALKAGQPYLSQFLRLQLSSGKFSVGGQASYGGHTGPRFQGDFALEQLRLDEADGATLFLALQSFGARKLTASAQNVDIPQLLLTGLDTKVQIAKDKTINVRRILVGAPRAKEPAGQAPPTSSPAAGSQAARLSPAQTPPAKRVAVAAKGKAAKPFQVDIGQLRVSDSALDYSDLSLALPFGTRIHDLHGVINGLSTRPDARGQIQLDGQVDDYGEAHAAGQLDLYDPKGYTDITVAFRNVEMTRLTPYSATFAGRRINSGKLSLDLEYKINKHQLDGTNSVLLDHLSLGDRVDTPGATNLPLDLAIAILEDSDGKIDLGLPVSGSVDDPQFSYGQLLWKAIVNLVGKIALAPFRALGNLFGGAGDPIEHVDFAPGSGDLAPPELEKLGQVAAVLAKRPGIAMAIPSPWADADHAALQDLQLRRALALRAGLMVGPNEDPGPVALREPAMQKAIEAEFTARQGAAALAALRKAARPPDGSAPGDAYYQDLVARMRSAQSVGDPELQALARQRSGVVLAGLQAAGVAATRLSAGDPAKVDAQESGIPLKFTPASAKGSP